MSIDAVEVLLLVAALVAMVARRLRVPYSVGLVSAGIALALLPFGPKIELTRDLVFFTLLPPLIFEAGFYIEWKELRRDLALVTTMATVGVALSATVVATGMQWLLGWNATASWAFGVLVAATDPVSVIATFKENGVRGRLRLLVESESLLNDGTAAVGFAIVLSHGATVPEAAGRLLLMVGGGLLVGSVTGWMAVLLTGRTADHLVQITFTVIAAYASFLLAERLHCSGVLATMCAGLIMGNVKPEPQGRETIRAFWDYAAFVANSFIFILIGLYEARQEFGGMGLAVAVGIVLAMLGRIVAVYPIGMLFSVRASHRHILFWGGLRGALALALALGLPAGMPGREGVITATFAVVAFSVFVQGLSMTPFLKMLGELPAVRK